MLADTSWPSLPAVAMGIPNLISTLEPYASHAALKDEIVVIDGPALAYHILHICRANGVIQPSYHLLGSTIISWLDTISSDNVSIKAIYFDGYLPLEKRPVRMMRMMKGTRQLGVAFSKYRNGCPRRQVNPTQTAHIDLFKTGQLDVRPLSDPSFFVPAIKDALNSCPRYQKLVHLVPGEADTYCASFVARHGGIVMTSDSDLLAHNLGQGRVSFLRDIYQDDSPGLVSAVFEPNQICQKLGLSSSEGLTRLAYERSRSPSYSLPQIIQACSQPVSDAKDFQDFLRQYTNTPDETFSVAELSNIDGLDPRISEFIVQLHHIDRKTPEAAETIKIFLPVLFESTALGSAWERSTNIRQLAYTVAKETGTISCTSLQEYRRVQNQDQKGRLVEFMSKPAATAYIKDLIEMMKKLKQRILGYQQIYWLIFCVTLDIRECQAQDKTSHILQVIEQAVTSPQSIKSANASWDTVHFLAQIQATCYSLRTLNQILTVIPMNQMPQNLQQLNTLTSQLPGLAEYPTFDGVCNFLKLAKQSDMLEILSEFVDIAFAPSQLKKHQDTPKITKKNTADKKRGEASRKVLIKSAGSTTNIFSLLSVDQ